MRRFVPFVTAMALAAIFAAALWLRVTSLESMPYPDGDEAWYGIQAEQFLAGRPVALLTPTGNPLNPFYAGLEVPLLKIFRPSLWILRVPSAACGILAVVLAYVLVSKLFDRTTGLITATLLATLPVTILFSRIGFDASETPLFSLLAVYFAFRGRPIAVLATFVACLLIHPTNVFLAPILLSVLSAKTVEQTAGNPRKRFWSLAGAGRGTQPGRRRVRRVHAPQAERPVDLRHRVPRPGLAAIPHALRAVVPRIGAVSGLRIDPRPARLGVSDRRPRCGVNGRDPADPPEALGRPGDDRGPRRQRCGIPCGRGTRRDPARVDLIPTLWIVRRRPVRHRRRVSRPWGPDRARFAATENRQGPSRFRDDRSGGWTAPQREILLVRPLRERRLRIDVDVPDGRERSAPAGPLGAPARHRPRSRSTHRGVRAGSMGATSDPLPRRLARRPPGDQSGGKSRDARPGPRRPSRHPVRPAATPSGSSAARSIWRSINSTRRIPCEPGAQTINGNTYLVLYRMKREGEVRRLLVARIVRARTK